MFFMGSSLYFWREKLFIRSVHVRRAAAYRLAASLLIGPIVAFPLYLLCVAPFMLHRLYSRRSDQALQFLRRAYSYGVYIYAFPVQQTLALLFPKITILAMAGSAGVISFALAFCSWNLVEAGDGTKDVCAEATRGAERGRGPFAAGGADPKADKLSPGAPSDASASHPSGAMSVGSGKIGAMARIAREQWRRRDKRAPIKKSRQRARADSAAAPYNRKLAPRESRGWACPPASESNADLRVTNPTAPRSQLQTRRKRWR